MTKKNEKSYSAKQPKGSGLIYHSRFFRKNETAGLGNDAQYPGLCRSFDAYDAIVLHLYSKTRELTMQAEARCSDHQGRSQIHISFRFLSTLIVTPICGFARCSHRLTRNHTH